MRINPNKDCVYPNYYFPLHNERKKLRLVQGYLLKTNVLYANHHETEIRLLLVKFASDNETVKDIVCHTFERFNRTCLSFGPSQAASHKGIPSSYLLMTFTDINNKKQEISSKREFPDLRR